MSLQSTRVSAELMGHIAAHFPELSLDQLQHCRTLIKTSGETGQKELVKQYLESQNCQLEWIDRTAIDNYVSLYLQYH